MNIYEYNLVIFLIFFLLIFLCNLKIDCSIFLEYTMIRIFLKCV